MNLRFWLVGLVIAQTTVAAALGWTLPESWRYLLPLAYLLALIERAARWDDQRHRRLSR